MRRPPHPDTLALRLEAEAAHRARDYPLALELYQKILNIDPLADDIWVHSAEILAMTGHDQTNMMALQKAVEINPENHLAWHNLAHAYAIREEWGKASDAIERAVAIEPDNSKSLFVLGNIRRAQGRHQDAIEAYKASLRIHEADADTWNNLGLSFYEISEFDAAAGAYLNALKHDINQAGAHTNLSILLLKVGKLEGARRSAERALAIEPNNHQALNTIGCLESLRGQHEIAIDYFNRALKAEPDFWKAHSNLLFCVLHKDGTTLEEVLRLHKEWYEQQGKRHARRAEKMIYKGTIDPDRRLRVGFVSGDFRRHPVGYFILNTFKRLAAEQPFDIYIYANQYETDEFTQQFRELAGANWRDVWEMKKENLVAQIVEDEIDVLFDLTGQNDRHRLDIFCARVAPVQVTWAGYMATTGVAQMDWLLGDHIQTPAADQAFYTERLYQMPHSFICYAPPPDAPPLRGVPPSIENGYITFASFNKPAKVTPRAVRLWSDIMRRVPGSKLLMKFSGLDDAQTAGFFIDAFARHGIGAERLVFEKASPHRELLARYNDADIALDPLPYTGSTTTLEALWMATPLVTLPGWIFPARHAATYLNSIGAHELIATDEADYVNKVVALANDTDRLRHYKTELRGQMLHSPLCNQDLFVPEFTKAVRFFWQDYCSRHA